MARWNIDPRLLACAAASMMHLFAARGATLHLFSTNYTSASSLELPHDLLRSFNRLLTDFADVKNQSAFTNELFHATFNALHNVPRAVIMKKVESQTNAAAVNNGLPNPDQDKCLLRDFTQLCPSGWYEIGDGKICKPSEEYSGSCGPIFDFSSATPLAKRSFSDNCGVYWPCKSACIEDYSAPCPSDWTDESGICTAPISYGGTCPTKKTFVDYDEQSKRYWATGCSVSWPCTDKSQDFTVSLCPEQWVSNDDTLCKAPPHYVGPCDAVLPIGGMNEAQKAHLARQCNLSWPSFKQTIFNFDDPCPLGWTLISQGRLECDPPAGYRGPCRKIRVTERREPHHYHDVMSTCSVIWPTQDIGNRNYAAPCPSQWTFEPGGSGVCRAPPTYTGPCEPRIRLQGYDTAMKKAVESRCRVFFPMSAFTIARKMPPSMITKENGNGPIGQPMTMFEGQVVQADGTVFMPSRMRWQSLGVRFPFNPSYASASQQSVAPRHTTNPKSLANEMKNR